MDEATQNQLRFIAIEKRLDELTQAIKNADFRYLEEIRLQGIRIGDIKSKVDNVDIRLKSVENPILPPLSLPQNLTAAKPKKFWKW